MKNNSAFKASLKKRRDVVIFILVLSHCPESGQWGGEKRGGGRDQ